MKKIILLLTIAITFFQCKKEDSCENVLCEETLPKVTVEILDKNTGENVFTSNKYSKSDLKIINTIDQKTIPYTLTKNNIIELTPSKQGLNVISQISLKTQTILNVETESEIIKDNCCEFTKLKDNGISYNYTAKILENFEILLNGNNITE